MVHDPIITIASLLARHTTRFEYDARGNLTKTSDNAGNITSFAFAAFNKVSSQTSAMGYALITSNEVFYCYLPSRVRALLDFLVEKVQLY